MRFMARLFAHDVGFKSFIRTYVLNLPITAMLFALIYAYLYVPKVNKNIFQENIHVFMFFGILEIILIIVSLLWTYLWSRPTRFEIENNYLND